MSRDEFDQSQQDDAVDAEFERKDTGTRALIPTYDAPLAHSDYWVRKPVPIERDLVAVEKRLIQEANLAGEDMYYAWGKGNDRIEGGSIILAMAVARCWGNCVIEQRPMEETRDAYIFTARFIDLETGFTLDRKFRQSKKWTVHGKMDSERKEDMRFQIGQSKAARNVILRALPEYLKNKAIEKAKEGVRARLEKFIVEKGIATAQDLVVSALVREGVPVERILEHYDIANIGALDIDKIVELRGNLHAIQKGEERADTLYPPTDVETAAADAAGKKPQVDEDLRQIAESLSGAGNGGSKKAPVQETTQTQQQLKPPVVQNSEAQPLADLRKALEQASTAEELDQQWKKWFSTNRLGDAQYMAAETIWGEILKRITGKPPTLPEKVKPVETVVVAPPAADVSEPAKEFAKQFANSRLMGGVNKILERAGKEAFNETDMEFIRSQHAARIKELEKRD